eukprot:6482312-Amphidinium_carterae.1
MAYLEQSPNTVTQYSPVVTPTSPQMISSSAPSSPGDLPVWESMSVKEAMNLLFVEDSDAVPEFTEDSLRAFWESDPMVPTYASFAPSWTKLFMKFALVNGYSTDKVPEGKELMYIHTTMSTFKRLELSGDLGSRFGFPSLIQAIAHQVCHDHFSLSNSTLRADSVIVHMLIDSVWLADHSHSATNGYAHSRSISSLPTDQVCICGCTYLLPGLKQFLTSEEGTTLTRSSVSHYEAFFEMPQVSSKRLVSLEMIHALTQASPNSGKMHATFEHQSPAFYAEVMSVLNSADAKKSDVKKSEDKKSESVQSTTTTRVTVDLGPDEEITMAVTKVKKQKLDEIKIADSVKIESTSATAAGSV